MSCCSLWCVGVVVVVVLVYKLVDRLLWRRRVSRLSDRYILVTGCDSGFGHDVARRLDALGCHVFAACLTDAAQTDLRTSCSPRLTALSMDVSSADSVRNAFNLVSSKLPQGQGLWGVLNNAGILGRVGPEEWLTLDDYRKVYSVNLLGLIDVTMTFLPLVKKSRGRIVNTASVFGRHTIPACAPYCTSKYAVESFSDSLRRAMRVFGCRVSLIEPGFHRTHITSGNNVLGLLTEAWNNAPPDVKEEYGQEFYDFYMRTAIEKNDKVTSDRVSDVVDAYEDALLSRCPRARYVVGRDARFLWLPIQALPESVGDWLLEAMDRDRAVPAAVKKTK